MQKLKIKKINAILKCKIACWDRYKNEEGYDDLKKYLCSSGVARYIFSYKKPKEKHQTFFDPRAKYYEYVLLDKRKVVSYARLRLDDYDCKNPQLYVQGIATHPKYHGKGYATALLKNLLNDSEKYFYKRPKSIYALVDFGNIASHKIFQKIGPNCYSDDKTFLGFDCVKINLEKGKNNERI